MLRLPPVTAPLVSVVVVSARDVERLVRCLTRVAEGAPGAELEMIVVLNAAEPGMAETLAARVSGVRVVTSEVPLGFAGGVNLGARHARGTFLHVLHDDTEVEPGWLDALVAALHDHPRAGAAGSLVFDLDGGAVQTAGHVLWRDGRTEPPWRGAAPDPASFDAVVPVDYCSSSSLLIRTGSWRAVGGFDEELHPGQYVDVDLAMGLRHHGQLVVLAPGSRVRHARGGSASPHVRAVAWRRNRERFLRKWAEDLAHQEPFAEDDGALDRAHAATARRARLVLERDPAPVAPRDDPPAPGVPESESDRVRREHRQLRRDVAFKAAALSDLDAALEHAQAHARGAEERVTAAARELDRVHAAHAAEHEARLALERRADELTRTLADRDAELIALRARSRTLDAILAGRWWRLRNRLHALARPLAAGRLRAVNRRSRRSAGAP